MKVVSIDRLGVLWRRERPQHRRERGQGTVEFALALPVLLLLVLGIIEFGRLTFSYIAVVTAVREAARYGAASGLSGAGVPYYRDCDGIRAAAIRIGSISGISNTEASVNIQYDNGPNAAGTGVIDNITANCPVGGTGPALSNGDRIVVEVVVTFNPTQGLISALPSFQIRSLARRTILVSIPVR